MYNFSDTYLIYNQLEIYYINLSIYLFIKYYYSSLKFFTRLISKPFAHNARTIISSDYPASSKLQLQRWQLPFRPANGQEKGAGAEETKRG